MSGDNKSCIYCRQDDPSKFKGVEHVIPQAFGVFGSKTPTITCVCDDCNAFFGKNHDIHLARETVEGVLRYNNGVFSSAPRPQKHLHITLAAGPETGQFAGMKVAIDGTSGTLMRPLAQFQILNQKTMATEVYYKSEIVGLKLPEAIYGKPGSDGVEGTWQCGIFAPSKDEHDEIVHALRTTGIAFASGDPFPVMPPMDPDADGKYTLPISIEGEIGIEHRQAHAKIFLNIIAAAFGCDEAIKPDWDFLRAYARFGQGIIKYRVKKDLLPTGKEKELERLIGKSIVVQVHNMREHVVGMIKFYSNHSYQYILRENASLPEEQEFTFIFTNGEAPVRIA